MSRPPRDPSRTAPARRAPKGSRAPGPSGGRTAPGRTTGSKPRTTTRTVRASSSGAAAAPRPRAARRPLSRSLLLTLLGKVLGLAVLLGVSALVYDLVASPEFRVRSISVSGNQLLDVEEARTAASVDGALIFWVRRVDVEARLRSLAPVAAADVWLQLPDRVHLVLREREPVAVWQAGNTSHLVDGEGRILAVQRSELPLLTVRDGSGQPLSPGSRVSADALRAAAGLDARLSAVLGPGPRTYEYLPDTGINVMQPGLPRLIFGASDDLDWKVEAIQAVLRHLAEQRQRAQLVDVRFRDRPYYR